jgi:hypothetical protein
MTAGQDVTGIRWEPVDKGGSGEVTIEHEHRDPVTISMDLPAARRLVNRLLGTDNVELASPGDGFRWDRESLVSSLTN